MPAFSNPFFFYPGAGHIRPFVATRSKKKKKKRERKLYEYEYIKTFSFRKFAKKNSSVKTCFSTKNIESEPNKMMTRERERREGERERHARAREEQRAREKKRELSLSLSSEKKNRRSLFLYLLLSLPLSHHLPSAFVTKKNRIAYSYKKGVTSSKALFFFFWKMNRGRGGVMEEEEKIGGKGKKTETTNGVFAFSFLSLFWCDTQGSARSGPNQKRCFLGQKKEAENGYVFSL